MDDRSVRQTARQIHRLKCWPEFYQDHTAGHMTHTIRRNDRDFQVGDLLVLEEYDQVLKRYTGRHSIYRANQITQPDVLWRMFGVEVSFVIMSIEPYECTHQWQSEPIAGEPANDRFHYCIHCGIEKTD